MALCKSSSKLKPWKTARPDRSFESGTRFLSATCAPKSLTNKTSWSRCDMKLFKQTLAGIVVASVIGFFASTGFAQSLWHDGVSKAMYSDKRASRVGDLITIVVQENTTANKDNSTSTSKKASMDAAITAFLYSPVASGLLAKSGQLPALKYASANSFDGGGSIKNSEQIVAQIT